LVAALLPAATIGRFLLLLLLVAALMSLLWVTACCCCCSWSVANGCSVVVALLVFWAIEKRVRCK
jgi:predicted small integral membrane protein